jgi:drug/metabolite transporter (DMT)-like permease
VLAALWIPLAAISAPQVGAQDYSHLSALVWLSLAFAVVGPLVLTNVLWFKSVDRVGPARATLVANLQPFLAALFAYLILSEHLHPLQIAGGFLILGGIMLERRTRPVAPAD